MCTPMEVLHVHAHGGTTCVKIGLERPCLVFPEPEFRAESKYGAPVAERGPRAEIAWRKTFFAVVVVVFLEIEGKSQFWPKA